MKSSSLSILSFILSSTNTSMKRNFHSSLFGSSEVQIIKEGQDKCLILALYLLVFKIMS